ncbi:hypothetical protein RRG08_025942 [Elysia crispata]|uniref:Uncharacterized protein n=1 Tax=Elysia crispata TaxID=231223 RepID=A0AAE0ZFV7_9GAST|nr:hypothetical protein RRG08_025942 [Elysia crispata]
MLLFVLANVDQQDMLLSALANVDHEFKTAGQCMFKECEGIKGTDDEERAAALLVHLAKDKFQCDIKEEELLGGGNKASSLLQKPVVGLLSGLLVISLGKIIL